MALTGIPFSQFADGGTLVATDKIVGLRDGANTIFDFVPSEWGYNITQVAHGFVNGNVLRLNGTIYTLAQANSAANSEVVGIVSSVINANEFQIQLGGLVADFVGLVAGDTYYLDPAVAGGITNVDPAIAGVTGQVSKPLLIANTTTTGWWFNFRGQVL